MDVETGSTAKSRLSMMVLEGLVGWWVSSGQPHPERLQQTTYSLKRRSLPPVPHWLSTMERTVSWMSPLHVALFPYRVSFFLPSQVTPAYFNKDFLASLSLPPTSCLLGDLPSAWTGEENGNPLQCSCLENHMDRGAWRAAVHRAHRVRHDWSN